MLVLHPISAEQSRYYLESPAPGRWIGSGCEDLGLRGPVDEASLRSVLSGREPGGEVLQARLTANRRSGFDLILAAPKSVSLVAAMADDDIRDRFHRAHDQAVASTLGYLERNAVWTRRGAAHTHMATSGLVAAAFRHESSFAGDPHLHSHVVVANVVLGDDGRWSALDSRALYRHGPAAGAVFQSTLRYHLGEQGLHFEWTVDHHGLGHIVGVPRAAVEAVSIRAHQIRSELDSGAPGRAERATAAGRTRRSPLPDRDHDPPDGEPGATNWRPRLAAAGFESAELSRLLGRAATVRQPPGARPLSSGPGRPVVKGSLLVDERALDRWLTDRTSRFHRFDVVRGAAALSVAGSPAPQLEQVAEQFLQRARRSARGAFTTATLERMEERILADARAPTRAAGLVRATTEPPQDLDDRSRQVFRQLTRGGAPVDLLRGDFMRQARVLEAARGAWEASSHRVAVMSQTDRGAARWRVVTGLAPPPPAPSHPTVVVVDNADRWPTADLHRVLADAAARQGKVVLLDGGTMPRRRHPESPAVEALRAALPTLDVSRTSGRSPGDHTVAGHQLPGPAPPSPLVPAGRDGSVVVTDRAEAAMHALVGDWQRVREGGQAARMVALGPEEAEHLNGRARAVRVQSGELRGPSVVVAGHTYQAGDEVAALRRDRRLGSVPGGTLGLVTEVDDRTQTLVVLWSGREAPVIIAEPGPRHTLPLTHGYATTPSYLRRGHHGAVLGLGDIESVAPRIHPERVYEVLPVTVDRDRQRSHPATRMLAELAGPAEGAAPASPSHASRPLADLASEHDRLGRALTAGAPAAPTAELRRLNEERAWLASIPNRPPPAQAALAALDARRFELAGAAATRAEWLASHRTDLERWKQLSLALAWREAALARGAEIRPTRAVAAQLGPVPTPSRERMAWRRAAQAIEGHRERWQLPDQPLALEQPAPGRERDRRADELRVLAATGELERSRGQDRELALTP